MGIEQEKKIVKQMIKIYCKKHHASQQDLCESCTELLNYAFFRLSKCPFKTNKPSCGKCLIKCYSKENKEKIKAVMRYSGPRMLLHNPIMTLKYMTKKFGKK